MTLTRADRTKQRAIAKEWIAFRTRFLFSQVQLAEALDISRRLVQYVESGKGQDVNYTCIPSAGVLANFKALKAKFEGEGG
ncbi:MAG TPA: hypothetical protein VK638_40675 [Edaphobacter sp.]|nr:hypothetical protein [Edaphobacter sp.]